jgi:DNA-directed RNA polymerase specialized sigma24 family protein
MTAMGETGRRVRVLEATATLRQISTQRIFPPPADPAHPEWRRVWDLFVRTYGPAMSQYASTLLRGIAGPAAAEDADDVVNDFVLAAMRDGRLSSQGERLRSFRRLLATLLRRHVLDHLDARRAAKRDPGTPVGEAGLAEAASREADPALAAFHAEIVRIALDRAMARVRARNETHAEILADLLRTDGVGSPDLAARLQGGDASRLADHRHRARRSLGMLLLEELRGLALDADDFEDLLAEVEGFLP